MILNTERGSLLLILCLISTLLFSQEILSVTYQDRPHFRIVTSTATYLYDRAGGGFSSLRDRAALEWIGFKPGKGKVPDSAAADFRGLPNLVYRGDDNGSGHPGFDKCISELLAPNRIRTKSLSGKWEWEWTFTQEGALLEIIRTDTTRNYWFLYEGTPGGNFSPQEQFWGTSSDGHRIDAPPIGSEQTGKGTWTWAYFGHRNVNRCLFILHLTPDRLEDSFSYMGNGPDGIRSADGMVVFGFGRDGTTPLMQGNNRFFIGLMDYTVPEQEIPGNLDLLYQQETDKFKKKGPPKTKAQRAGRKT